MEEAPDPQEPDPSADPCADPDEAAGWTMDAVAVRIFNALREWANSRHPDGINEREYGAAIWRLPNGQFVAGPMSFGQYAFNQQHLGPINVSIDMTPPDASAIYYGLVHTHGVDGRVASGSSTTTGDLGIVTEGSNYLRGVGVTGVRFTMYIGSNATSGAGQPQTPVLVAYDSTNLDDALAGEPGAEVDPNSLPCPGLVPDP